MRIVWITFLVNFVSENEYCKKPLINLIINSVKALLIGVFRKGYKGKSFLG